MPTKIFFARNAFLGAFFDQVDSFVSRFVTTIVKNYNWF